MRRPWMQASSARRVDRRRDRCQETREARCRRLTPFPRARYVRCFTRGRRARVLPRQGPEEAGMPKFVVQGGKPLRGEIRPAGNKNAALPIIAAALLTEEEVILENVPAIRDVRTLLELVSLLGAETAWIGPNTVRIQAKEVRASAIEPAMAARIRASILLAGPMLARVGRMTLPPPGGDVIGRRRVDTHFLALAKLGAQVEADDGYSLSTSGLRGTDIFLDEPSVTATENAIMAAVMAKGYTRIRNAAAEPHVQDLCNMLVQFGAKISGIGTGVLEFEGVDRLGGGRFRIGSDHIEVGSFIGLAAVTGGEILIRDAAIEHLDSTLLGFERMGIRCEKRGDDLFVPAEQDRVIRTDLGGHIPKIDDGPWPAFPAEIGRAHSELQSRP